MGHSPHCRWTICTPLDAKGLIRNARGKMFWDRIRFVWNKVWLSVRIMVIVHASGIGWWINDHGIKDGCEVWIVSIFFGENARGIGFSTDVFDLNESELDIFADDIFSWLNVF